MKKIALACFIGGALMCAVALVCAPNFWWLGLLAGLAGGYVSYKFREVLRAIPIAWRTVANEVKEPLNQILTEIKIGAEWLFYAPHPFTLFGALCGCASFLPVFWYTDGNISTISELPFIDITLPLLMASCFAAWGGGFVAMILATDAINDAGYIWLPTTELQRRCCQQNTKEKRQEVPLTYKSATKWALKGALDTSMQAIATSIWLVGAFIWLVWQVFKLIHSNERLLCAVDGTLGGVAAYLWMASAAETISEQALLVIFGGLLGAAFGVVHKSASERLTKTLEPASA